MLHGNYNGPTAKNLKGELEPKTLYLQNNNSDKRNIIFCMMKGKLNAN